MLTDRNTMEVKSQIAQKPNNKKCEFIKEAMIYNLNIPIHYASNKQENRDNMNTLNNNINKSNLKTNKIKLYNQSLSANVERNEMKVPMSLMPPPHKVLNFNLTRKWDRDDTKNRDYYRPISPKGYDSDESCTSLSSRGTPDNGTGMRYTISRTGGRLGDQTELFGKYSHSSPNVYQHTIYQHHSGHNYKNRYNNNNNTSVRPKHVQNHSHYHYRGNDVIVRRAHGLFERFRSRAELMRVDPNPAGLLNGSLWDPLNQAIWDVFSSKAQKEQTYESKISLWKNVFLFIRKCLSSYGLFMVGSTMSGFGLEGSDIDMCLLTKPTSSDARLDALQHLHTVRHLLMKSGITIESELILAKVPILKFKDKQTGFEIDLNCNNAVGIKNTHLLHSYARLDWRVRPLVVMVKLWAQANHINDAKNMTVSSYSWALMVIHYLQCGVSPPVLPCLHALMPEKFNSNMDSHSMDVQEDINMVNDFKSDNSNCLAELFVGFLHYYTYFNFNQCAISVRTGGRLQIEECRFAKAPKNDPHQWKYLCIEEPFDLTNTARSVFDVDVFNHIKNVIVCSYKELANGHMLNNILPINLSVMLNIMSTQR